MSTAANLLSTLRTLGVQLRLDGDTLRLNAPKGSLTPALQSELKAAKDDLLDLLRSMKSNTASETTSSIARLERKPYMPLSYAQQRLWFLQQMEPANAAYNLLAVLRLEGSLDAQALELALRNILLRHESMRTTFVKLDGSPHTVIGDGANWHLDRLPLNRLADESREAAIARFTRTETQYPLDLETGPLLRAYLLEESAQDHVLVMSIHHIISDGWSMGVAVKEIAENYRALRLHQTPSLKPLPIQYVDYAEWQRNWLASGVGARQLLYWRKQLAGAPATTVFPPDYDRSTAPGPHGRRSKLLLPIELVKALEAFSRKHDATLFMTMLSAFMLLLSRYSGQEDVVVGSPSANRGHTDISELIGFFVNNLVLRASVEGDISFQDLLKRVRETTIGAFEHQDLPFDELVRELVTERNRETSPLFQTMFILQNFPLEELELPQLIVTPLEVDAQTARFDLTVEIYPRKGELYVFFDYRSDLYSEQTILDLQQSFEFVLRQVVFDPTILLKSVALLPTPLRQRALDWRNDRSSHAPTPLTLIESLRQHTLHHPEKIAVCASGQSLTYAELSDQSDQLSTRLRQSGVTPASLVPILLARSVDLLVSMLAVHKAGAAYIPLDPIYPRMRIASILDDVRPTTLVTQTNLLPLIEGYECGALLVDAPTAMSSESSDTIDLTLSLDPSSADPAYVIFTSGSTGKPKGVEISHGALANFLTSMQHTPGFTSEDRLLAVTTVSFDIAGLELFLPIYSGGQVRIATAPGDLPTLLADIDREQPTVLQATPALWQMLLSSGWKGNQTITALCGGEALNADLAKTLVPHVKELWNMYGPTETTIWSSAVRIDHAAGLHISLGGPIENTSFYVLDPQREPVPIGVAGELYIGGDGVADGYFNQPALTSEKFVANPFEPGTRLYRTGDLVRRRRDNQMEFLGRADFQVKLRGFRIELGEIEHVLRQQPEIYETVVLLREFAGEKALVAYLVLNQGESLSYPRLRPRLRESLPEYMVPATAVILPTLPRLPNGKLDRSQLPVPEQPATEPTSEILVNQDFSPTEEKIASVFRELLQTHHLGLTQRFFEFGAHSLLLVKAHHRLKRELDSELRLVSFFEHPSIAQLAAYIDRRHAVEREAAYAGHP